MSLLEAYADIAGAEVVAHLRQLAAPLAGARVVHVNSTRVGGGVAEILTKLIPLTRELGIDAHWEVISGDSDFFECTKGMHNTLQGNRLLASAIAAGKLVLHPAMVALAVLAMPLAGFAPLPDDLRIAAILSAAIPMFGVYVVLSQPYGHGGIASLALLLATAGSFVTLTALLALLA